MDSSYTLGAVIGPTFIILGISMFLQYKVWSIRLENLIKKDEQRVMFGLIEWIIGLAIIHSHNVWEISPWLIITLTGWIMMLEGAFHLFAPHKKVVQISKEFISLAFLRIFGGVIALLGVWLSSLVYLS